jgi:hypothetical protein
MKLFLCLQNIIPSYGIVENSKHQSQLILQVIHQSWASQMKKFETRLKTGDIEKEDAIRLNILSFGELSRKLQFI